MKRNLFVLVLLMFVLAMAVAAPKSSGELSMGEWKKNVYTNDFLGIKYRLPEGWTRYGDAEMAEIMQLGTELISDNQKYLAELAKLNLVYYMLVNNPSTGDNIVVLTEKSALDYTVDYYIDAVKTQLQNVDALKYEFSATSKEKIAGVEYNALVATASTGNISMTQKYYARKMGKYFVSIIASSRSGEAAINDMMKAFE